MRFRMKGWSARLPRIGYEGRCSPADIQLGLVGHRARNTTRNDVPCVAGAKVIVPNLDIG